MAQLDKSQLIKDFITRKYVSDNDELQEAKDKAREMNLVAGLGEALSTAANADAVSRGAKAPKTDIFNSIRDQARNKIQQVVEGRKQKQQDILQNIQLAQSLEDSDRAKRQMDLQQRASDLRERELDLRGQNLQENLKLERDKMKQAGELKTQALAQKIQSQAAANKGLEVPNYGTANTRDDAKKIKDAIELKNKFDRQLQEMIRLRESKGGGELFDRDAVARGKQLSKDALLTLKNLAKLGVLSKSDENIINEIIPSDPLEFNSIIAEIQGQDPTLTKLKGLASDIDKDFKTTLETRLSNPESKKPEEDVDSEIEALEKELGLR